MKNRINVAITALCFVVITLFTATRCVEEPDEDVLYLHAKVENASQYNKIVAVKLMMRDNITHENVELARGDWKNGGFTIALPKIDKNNYREFACFRILPMDIIQNSTTITISNENARSGIAEFLGVDKDGNVVTKFFPHKIDENDNAAMVSFNYVNSDVNISGYVEAGTLIDEYDEYINADMTWGWKNLTVYSIECKEGWNVSSFSSFQSPKETITDKNSTIPLNCSLKWRGGESWWELD